MKTVYEDDGSDHIPAIFHRSQSGKTPPNQEKLPNVLARFLAIETVLPELFPQYIKGLRMARNWQDASSTNY